MTKEKLNRIVIGVIVLGFMMIPVYLCYSCNLLNHSKKLGVATITKAYPYHDGGYIVEYSYNINQTYYGKYRDYPNQKVEVGKYYMIYVPKNPSNSKVLFDFPARENTSPPNLYNINVDCFCNVSHLK